MNSKHKEIIATNLKNFGVNDLAIIWLLDLWDIIQEIDDIADEGTCDYKNLAEKVFVSIPSNPWYQANMVNLAPLLATQMYKWFAANTMEDAKEEAEKAYMLRAGYYDIILYVVSLHGQISNPELVMKLYGENFQDYYKEVYNA